MSARMTHRFLSNGRRVSEHLFRLQRCKDNAVSLFESVPLSATNQSALTHFDKFYPKVYGPLGWSTMRAALLCPSGKAFLLNRFSSRFGELWTKGVGAYKLDLIRTLAKHQSVWNAPQSVMDSTVSEEQKSREMNRLVQPQFLSQMGTHSATSNMNLSEFVPATALISETELFTRECDLDVTFTVADPNIEGGLQWISEDWKLPDRLCVMCSKFGRIPGYRSPKFLDGQFDFYPLDLGSLVPVLSLNLQRDDTLLDLCAAPGGKALAALQTGLPRLLICLDNSSSRLLRLQEVIATHSSQASPIDPIVHVLHETELGRFLSSDLPPEDRLFSKILVDVPCSADRHALTSDKGSVFSRGRSKERLGLPTTQTRLLLRAMNLCRPEGSVVYSTCTLSPAQNQAIVESCLSKGDGKAQFAVVDLTPLVKAFELVQSELGLRLIPIYGNQWQRNPLGVLVVPSIAANYGPTFVSKLKRIA